MSLYNINRPRWHVETEKEISVISKNLKNSLLSRKAILLKALLAAQIGDWKKAISLGEEVILLGNSYNLLYPKTDQRLISLFKERQLPLNITPISYN